MVCSADACFPTAAVYQEKDVGYNALQVNYELLTKSIDPQDVLRSMFSHQLISLEQKKEIRSMQKQRGKEDACEEMLDILLNNWKRGTCERLIQVLEKSNYKECAVQLQSNIYVAMSVFIHTLYSSLHNIFMLTIKINDLGHNLFQ